MNYYKIGDRIRAYDFNPKLTECEVYCEGIILGITKSPYGYECYEIISEVDYHDWRVGENVYVPLRLEFLDYEDRITRV